jgi:DNA-binding NarL/FixJ family response regulator
VIRLVAEGLSNKEIGELLSISPRTVNFHLDNLFAKLGVRSRTEAAILALRQGWIERKF